MQLIEITETESGDLLKVTSQGIKVTLIGYHCVEKTYSVRMLSSRSAR